MTDNIIEISSLNFSYGSNPVLKDLSFGVPRGKITCLMGQNGCGKTTLIDTVMGLNRYKSGSVLLDGKEVSEMKPVAVAQKIAYVPQLHSITFPYTVKEVVLMGRTAYTGLFGSPKKSDETIAEEAMEKVGISDYADRPYSQLSGGEIKLVLLARALGQCSDIIIMDEPTAHLDLRNELLFLETVSEIVRNEGKTVLISTHSPTHAFFFKQRHADVIAALMKDGAIHSVGDPEEVVTEQSIVDVFGVKADVVDVVAEDGTKEKTICLRNTIERH